MTTKSLQEMYVLLVEPSQPQSKYILNQLNESGISRFESVKDGQSALDAMHMYRPDLVISSMYLPDMTGSDLIHAMRADDDLQDMPFMLISSETGFDMIDPIRQAGVTAILPKPFESDQLKRALFNTLDMINPKSIQLDDFHAEDLKVLVVDDSLTARKHIKRVLAGLGIENIVEADDGVSAVPVLAEQFFDFVVTDYNMPQMDGKALIEYIRNNSNQGSVPVLMVTSEGNMNNLAAVEQAGVSGICDKPFETDTVRALIQNMLSDI
ncbi:MAG: response regulator [Gammaproteobacteria bacterium]|nr:response regulator [Gammaproteobacteria bacterium]MCW8910080.1 response regulator [Gammaproteobacteria bacterium]MCW9005012.1 response regulator [Gammaproteobacteria bacterium]MCW9055835.1 response regulator [Gammaproteobacteria bacterium]